MGSSLGQLLANIIMAEMEKTIKKFIDDKILFHNTTNNDFETIWIKIPYLSDKGEQLLKSLKTKLKHHLKKDVKFRIILSTPK